MAEKKKTKTRYIDINVKEGTFAQKLMRKANSVYNPDDVSALRKLLSNEKARILYALKNNSIKSIYSLAKHLKRDFKSVRQDLLFLEKFGFVEFHSTKKGKRKSLTPILVIDQMNIVVNI